MRLKSKLVPLFKRFLKLAGVDKSIRWSLMTQGLRLLTGPITLVLIIKFLTLEAQGFYYAFASVLGLSLFLELGFSQNILQFAAHEFAHLRLTERRELVGDTAAVSRLVSLGRLAFVYYGSAAIAFFVLITIGGNWFFRTGVQQLVEWQNPWLLGCLSGALSLAVNPCWALLQGCNQVSEVEKIKFRSTLLSFIVFALSLMGGFGLYAPSLASLTNVGCSIWFLGWEWMPFFRCFIQKPDGPTISWQREIWPFQWRIAVSCISGYLIFYTITPVVFKMAGPSAAAKIGFTLQLVTLISTLSLTWSTTKIPLYGMLVARREWANLAAQWKGATAKTLLVAVMASVAMLSVMEIATQWSPRLNERYAGLLSGSILAAGMVVQIFTTACSLYLRAFKQEPYMILALINGFLSIVLIIFFAKMWGVGGAALGYSSSILLVALPAYQLFQTKRKAYINANIAAKQTV